MSAAHDLEMGGGAVLALDESVLESSRSMLDSSSLDALSAVRVGLVVFITSSS